MCRSSLKYPGVTLEHFAFSATGLKDFLARLEKNNVKYDARKVPRMDGVQINVWDPDGNHIHVDFEGAETAGVTVQGSRRHRHGALIISRPGSRDHRSRLGIDGLRRSQHFLIGNCHSREASMCTRIHATALAAVLACAPALADTFPQSAPEKVGLSGERLQRIASVLKADVEKGRLPGAVVAIARKGKLAYFETVGFLDAARKVEMPRDAIFSLASMSKPMTSIAILMLIEEGRLFLSDPVAKYLPAMADMKVGVVKADAQGKETVETQPAKRQPTIQDLLRHTSGLTYGGRGETPVHKLWPAGSAVAAVNYTGSELVAHIGKLPLLYQPGTVWDYGLSVDVLGLVVEAISGQSLGAFLQERLWGPLGMADTSFAIPDDKKGRYALAFPNDPLTGKAQTVLHAGQAHQVRLRRRLRRSARPSTTCGSGRCSSMAACSTASASSRAPCSR